MKWEWFLCLCPMSNGTISSRAPWHQLGIKLVEKMDGSAMTNSTLKSYFFFFFFFFFIMVDSITTEKQLERLLTVCPIPSTSMVTLCTRWKPCPVTVMVLPPLWHTPIHPQTHTNTHTYTQKMWAMTKICQTHTGLDILGHCTKPREKQGKRIIMQSSSTAVKIRTRHQRHSALLSHTRCYLETQWGENTPNIRVTLQ